MQQEFESSGMSCAAYDLNNNIQTEGRYSVPDLFLTE